MQDPELAARKHYPSAGVIDSQTVRAPSADKGGHDAAKVVGRARRIAVVTAARLLGGILTSADIADSTGGQAVLEAVKMRCPGVMHLFATGSTTARRQWTRRLRSSSSSTWCWGTSSRQAAVSPRRWVVVNATRVPDLVILRSARAARTT